MLTQWEWFTLHWGSVQQKPALKLPDKHPKPIPDYTTPAHTIYIGVILENFVLFRKRMIYSLFDLIFCNPSAGTSDYTASVARESAKLDTDTHLYREGAVWRLLDCTIKSQWPSHWTVGYHFCPVLAVSMHSHALPHAWHNIPLKENRDFCEQSNFQNNLLLNWLKLNECYSWNAVCHCKPFLSGAIFKEMM